MARKMGTFGADVAAFARRSNLTLDEAHRGIIINLFSSVVDDTPVEEGTLRANWNISDDRPDESTSPSAKDPSGSATKGKIQGHKIKVGGKTLLTNAMPYAEVAEYGLWSTGSAGEEGSKVTSEGFSKKAPAGMVRKNMARVQSIVRGEVSKAKKRKKK